MTLILLDDAGSAAGGRSEYLPASRGRSLPDPKLVVVTPNLESLPSLANIEQKPSDAPAAQEAADLNPGARAALFGLYMGQIQARIERAWQRPRSPIEAIPFECHVQISQSEHGEIAEVELLDCTDDLRWQNSLVEAINMASPLPAPPVPAVFTRALRLTFRSEGDSPERSEDGFAFDAPRTVSATHMWTPLPAPTALGASAAKPHEESTR
jgi:hypothetical protein